MVLDNSDTQTTVTSNATAGEFTYQSSFGLFGQVGVSTTNITEVEVDDTVMDSDESTDSTMVGIGYRFRTGGAVGKYLGFGVQRADPDESGSDPVDIFRFFFEKDNNRRYGIVQLTHSTDGNLELTSLNGRHLWFVSNNFAIGFNWGIGAGDFQATGNAPSADVGTANLGVNLLFRPRF